MVPEPRRLNIEVSTRCNLNCETCVRSGWQEDLGDMSLETYKRLLPVFPELKSISLYGIGEPLLNDHLMEMIRLAKACLPSSGTVSFATNGTLIDKRIAQLLVSSGIDDIVVSIDGVTPETFRRIMGGANLDEVLRNIRLLGLAREQLGSRTPRIGIQFVAMKRNIEELPAVVELAAEYQVSFIIVSHLLPHIEEMRKQILHEFSSDQAIEVFNHAKAEARSRKLELRLYPEWVPHIFSLFGLPPLRGTLPSSAHVARNLPEEKEQVLQILERVVTKGLEENVMVNFTKLMPGMALNLAHTAQVFDLAQAKAQRYNIALDLPPLVPRARRECGFIREGICFVSWDGYVRPCNNLNHSYRCYINDRPKNITSVSFGNVMEQDFSKIWNREDYIRFRELVDRFDFAPCGDCNFADGCYYINGEAFRKDCYNYTQPCGDCPWARGILKCS